MNYICIEIPWREAYEQGDIKEAIKRIRVQIATNLMNVHNLFSDEKLTSYEDIYGPRSYQNVRKGETERFRPFKRLAIQMCEIEYNGELNIPDKDTLDEYIKMEKELEDAMKNI